MEDNLSGWSISGSFLLVRKETGFGQISQIGFQQRPQFESSLKWIPPTNAKVRLGQIYNIFELGGQSLPES